MPSDSAMIGQQPAEESTSGKHHQQEASRHSEELFRTTFEQSPISTQILSPDGRTVEVNRAWEELWGVTLDQLKDYNILEDQQLIAKGIMPYIKKAFAGEATEIPPVLYDPNQTIPNLTVHEDPRRWVRAFIYPVKDQAGNIRKVVLMHEDITARKQAEEISSRWRHIFEHVGWGVVIGRTDRSTLELMNPAYARMHGYTVEELTGKPILDVFAPECRAELAENIRLTMEKGHHVYESMHIRKDGTIFPVLVESTAITDENGEVLLAAHVQDITERKQAEAALREADQRAIAEYERLLERVASLGQALGTARDLTTIFRALRDFAVASVPCVGMFISLYDPERDVRTAAYAWGDGEEADVSQLPPMPITDGLNSRAVRTGQIIITDDYLTATQGHPSVPIGPDNSRLPQSSLVVPMAVMGRIVGTIEVQSYELAAYKNEHATAMSMAANLAAVAIENARLFEQESRARALAEESNRLKDEFLATLSHELRTPLTSIYGWARLLRTGSLDEKGIQHAIDAIDRNSQAQKQLIDDILDVSRIITGRLRLNIKPISLVPVIEAAVDAVRPAAVAKHIQLQVFTPTQVGLITGDPDRLQQVAWNLLSNAIKFTPQGGRVEVRLERSDDAVQIKVSDTGQGITPEFLPYVFDRFRQADQAITRAHGGLGLGLAIVRHLVELHGGTVTADSKGPGQGATFTVSLPLAAVISEGSEAEAIAESAEAAPETECPPALNDLRVLIVDDEAETLDFLSTVLGSCGAEVTAVTSAAAALRSIKERQPDVLISDIGMPGEDGYALIRKVRRLGRERGGRIPAIALTAYAREEDRLKAFRAGYQMHLAKPVEPSDLTAVVASFAGRTQEN